MPLYHDEGVVLRTYDLGEADRIVSILTRRHGKVRAVARGVRREKSRFGSRLEPFMRSDLLIATGRSLDVVSQASVLFPYARGICADYNAYLAANVVAETADRLHADPQHASKWRDVSDDENATDSLQYNLLVGALASLARGMHTPQTIAYSYVLRAMARGGWLPRLDSCTVCGDVACTHFSVSGGGVFCDTHMLPDSRATDRRVLDELTQLLTGDWGALDAAPDLDATTIAIVEDWSEYYLERPIRSLRLLHSMI
ncbi:DNA repair protein RecO [Pseudoscardovia radai]|uniref:DNA repair protein RecO n=1 Tax=Pseudoscardovia radai TaxID=987066 RepID=A0A261EYA5_9BIFI|nr:DNA repair protein RecO [Pseudoscardovia radai]OZG51828.1 DNA repair protein RecO [Pseudoscardovia radai]